MKALLHCRHWAVLAFTFPCLALRSTGLAALVSESLLLVLVLLLMCSLASSDASVGSTSGAGPAFDEIRTLADPALFSVCSDVSDRSSMNSLDV